MVKGPSLPQLTLMGVKLRKNSSRFSSDYDYPGSFTVNRFLTNTSGAPYEADAHEMPSGAEKRGFGRDPVVYANIHTEEPETGERGRGSACFSLFRISQYGIEKARGPVRTHICLERSTQHCERYGDAYATHASQAKIVHPVNVESVYKSDMRVIGTTF